MLIHLLDPTPSQHLGHEDWEEQVRSYMMNRVVHTAALYKEDTTRLFVLP